ncbi:unnamed protein product [Spirodela intermedia]|uniref:Uncharacterized protein n=1 Tax=Spirodela intermedia TaxID=51605 RepID=A0A7I8KE02_SPIIN|nr:unnamed protein product [Spirodela intermedia]
MEHHLVVAAEMVIGDGDRRRAVNSVDEPILAVVERIVTPSPSERPMDDDVGHVLHGDAGPAGDVHGGASAVDGLLDGHVVGEDDPKGLFLNDGVPEGAWFWGDHIFPFLPPMAFLPKPMAQSASCCRFCSQLGSHRQQSSMGLPVLQESSASRRRRATEALMLLRRPKGEALWGKFLPYNMLEKEREREREREREKERGMFQLVNSWSM